MKTKMTIQEWPLADRPYEKLEQLGAKALSDAELVAAVISSGMNGKTSVELAMQLLATYENIGFLQMASLEELQKVSGIGRVKAIRIKAAIEIGNRVNNYVANQEREHLNSCHKAILYFENQLRFLPREEFHLAMLNIKQELIRTVQVSTGNIKSIELDVREIFREAIRSNAAGVILAHNHPSGDPTPSERDIITTKKIYEMGKQLDVHILDHIIVGAKESISLKAAGYI
ncbi:MAG: DNA repair protein RadC [Clostridiaceae bacterium]|nr:DNA repair protein RadC [Clostridiaceae bacterium]